MPNFENDLTLKDPFVQHDVPVSSPFVLQDKNFHSSSEDDGQDQSNESEDELSDVSDSINIDEPYVSGDFELLDDIHDTEKLYPSSKLTVVKSLALLFSWFCSSPGTSKESFSRLLHILNVFLLPDGNSLPESYAKALTTIKHFIVPVQKHDSCINDCIIFRKSSDGNFKEMSECPKCNEPRYQRDSKIARKVFKYIPLAPRLNRMFKNEKISRDLQSHLKPSNSSATVISDIHQSQAWKSRYNVTGPFRGMLVEFRSVSVLME